MGDNMTPEQNNRISNMITSGFQGWNAAQARNYEQEQKRNAMMQEIEKVMTIEQMKNSMRINNSGNVKPAPGMKLISQKVNQFGIEERQYGPTTPKVNKPEYKVVGGKILQLPSVAGELPTVAYEDPDKIKARQGASEGIIKNTEDMLKTVQTVRKGKKYFGRAGNVPSLITAGFNDEEYGKRTQWEAETQKLMAQRMMEKMIELKVASKTGSTGFGQLTEREGRKIQEASTALNRNLTPDVADKYLVAMEDSLNKIIEGARRESLGYSIGEEAPSSIFQPPVSSPTASPASAKVMKARQLRQQYPNLSKKQILDMVNKEF